MLSLVRAIRRSGSAGAKEGQCIDTVEELRVERSGITEAGPPSHDEDGLRGRGGEPVPSGYRYCSVCEVTGPL